MDHMYTLLSLEVPTADRIKKIQHLIDNITEFHADVGSQVVDPKAKKPPYAPLKEALWQCSNEFNKKGRTFKENDSKRVWVFTNDDNPNCKYPAEQLQIIQVGKDLGETDIEISLWHFDATVPGPASTASAAVAAPPTVIPFNIDIFYNKILVCDEEALEERTHAAPDESFVGMLSTMRKKQFKKRRMGSLAFYLGGDPTSTPGGVDGATALSVHVYKTLNVTKRPTATTLYSLTNQPAVVKTHYIDSSTGEEVRVDEASGSDVTTYVDVQGTRVPLSKAEVVAITKACALGTAKAEADTEAEAAEGTGAAAGAGNGDGSSVEVGAGFLKLLYFTAKTSLPADLNCTPGYFLTPDERGIRGSSLLFATLLDDLYAKQLIGVGVFVRNKSSQPRIVAIWPQKEGEAHTADADTAEGLFLIPLPFAGDLRTTGAPSQAQVETAPVVSEEAFKATLDVVRSLAAPVAPPVEEGEAAPGPTLTLPANPAMQRFYAVLQAIALSENIDQTTLDALDAECFPDKEVFARDAAVFQAFQEVLQLEGVGVAAVGAGVGKKRSAAAATSVSDGDKSEYKELAASGGLKKRTVPELKEICRTLGVGVTGKKDDLIARITSAVA